MDPEPVALTGLDGQDVAVPHMPVDLGELDPGLGAGIDVANGSLNSQAFFDHALPESAVFLRGQPYRPADLALSPTTAEQDHQLKNQVPELPFYGFSSVLVANCADTTWRQAWRNIMGEKSKQKKEPKKEDTK